MSEENITKQAGFTGLAITCDSMQTNECIKFDNLDCMQEAKQWVYDMLEDIACIADLEEIYTFVCAWLDLGSKSKLLTFNYGSMGLVTIVKS